MSDNSITLNCIVHGVKIIGSFGDSFLNGEEKVNNTRLFTRCEINVPFEEFTVENVNEYKKYKVFVGDVFIVAPKIHHLYFNGMSCVKNYSFRLELENVSKTPESGAFYDELTKNLYCQAINIYYMSWALEIVSAICLELKKGSFLSAQLARNKFEEFILLLLREILDDKINSAVFPSLTDSEVVIRNEKIDHFFNTKYNIPDITIKDLAKDLNLSVSQVNRILKEEYNATFHAKLMGRRLMHGKNNLVRTDRSIETIASKIGFSSVAGFYVAFKKEFGMTPSEYRKKYKEV